MRRAGDSTVSVLELCFLLEDLLETTDLATEAEYRIRKLISRTSSIADKMFVKTVKGQELILECVERTRLVKDQLVPGGESLYRGLTQLENAHSELIRRACEFRVKAG